MDVIEFDSLRTTVLHPEQLTLGGVKIWTRKGVSPRCVIKGDDDGFASEDELHGVPFVLGEIDFLKRQMFIQAVGTADLISRPTLLLTHGVIRVFGMRIDLELDAGA